MWRLLSSSALLLLLCGCWGAPADYGKETAKDSEPAGKEKPKSMAQKRSLDPVSTPIYAGEDAKASVTKVAVFKALQMYELQEGHPPATLQELVDKKYLPTLPKTPVGYQYKYNPGNGEFDVVLKDDK